MVLEDIEKYYKTNPKNTNNKSIKSRTIGFNVNEEEYNCIKDYCSDNNISVRTLMMELLKQTDIFEQKIESL